MGPPEPRSSSLASRLAALLGREELGRRDLPVGFDRQADDRLRQGGGGLSEAAGCGRDAVAGGQDDPVAGSSETSPPPLCQIPACEFWSVPTPDSSLHMVVMAWVVVLTPTTIPR